MIFCSFGDMLRVPGSRGDLLAAQVAGQRRPDRLFAARRRQPRGGQSRPQGRLLRDRLRDDRAAQRHGRLAWRSKRRLTNFSVLVSHVLVPPVMTAILEAPDNRVQGFLGPGHVCTVMGYDEYEPIARDYRVPIVITGFEPLDLLEGILLDGPAARRRAAPRSRTPTPGPSGREGNPASRRLIDDVFEVCDRKWRGIGLIPQSGYKLRDEYRDHDAERLFEVDDIETQESSVCISGQILKGLKKPHDCPAFGSECTPQTPLGATMVSSEGACAAYYAYGRHLEAGSADDSLANPISQPSLPQVSVGGGH